MLHITKFRAKTADVAKSNEEELDKLSRRHFVPTRSGARFFILFTTIFFCKFFLNYLYPVMFRLL